MYSHSRAAFTLWEILGVLCIIAVVTAILYPVFQKVSENSHPRGCSSNMKQLGLALIQYAQDCDEKMPVGVNALNNGWAGEIYSYTKSTGLYECPNDPHEKMSYISYALNQRVAGQNVVFFSAPQATVELYEATTLHCDPSTPERVSGTGLTAPQDSVRHDPATFALNYLVADGHVKFLKPGAVSSGLYAVSPKQAAGRGYMMTFAVK